MIAKIIFLLLCHVVLPQSQEIRGARARFVQNFQHFKENHSLLSRSTCEIYQPTCEISHGNTAKLPYYAIFNFWLAFSTEFTEMHLYATLEAPTEDSFIQSGVVYFTVPDNTTIAMAFKSHWTKAITNIDCADASSEWKIRDEQWETIPTSRPTAFPTALPTVNESLNTTPPAPIPPPGMAVGRSAYFSFGQLVCIFVSSVSSMLGSILIIASWFLFPSLHTQGRKLLNLLATCEFITSLCYLLLAWYFCTRQESFGFRLCSICLSYFKSASFCWSLAILYHCYSAVLNRHVRVSAFHGSTWAASFIGGGLFYLISPKIPTTGWVDIKDIEIELAAGRGFELIAYFIAFYLFNRIRIHLKKILDLLSKDQQHKTYRTPSEWQMIIINVLYRISLLPVFMVCSKMFGTARILVYQFGFEESFAYEILSYLTFFFDPLGGVLSCIIFIFMNPEVRHKYATLLGFATGAHLEPVPLDIRKKRHPRPNKSFPGQEPLCESLLASSHDDSKKQVGRFDLDSIPVELSK